MLRLCCYPSLLIPAATLYSLSYYWLHYLRNYSSQNPRSGSAHLHLYQAPYPVKHQALPGVPLTSLPNIFIYLSLLPRPFITRPSFFALSTSKLLSSSTLAAWPGLKIRRFNKTLQVEERESPHKPGPLLNHHDLGDKLKILQAGD